MINTRVFATPSYASTGVDHDATDTAGAPTAAGSGHLLTRDEWVKRAGAVAAYREATGWSHPNLALGRCPGVSTPEKRAAWHAAYTAAGEPEERRPEAEMTDGRLLVRARAAERATAAAPPSAYDAQRERHRLAEDARRAAVLAEARGDVIEAARLETEAAHHGAAAERLDEVAGARTEWLAAHDETLTAGESARDELARRGITPGLEPKRTTAAEWLAAEAEARTADDDHRTITEHDLAADEVDTAAHHSLEDCAMTDQAAPTHRTVESATHPSQTCSFTRAELDLIHATAEAKGLAVEVCSAVVPDDAAIPSAAGRHRPEVARILRDLEKAASRSVRNSGQTADSRTAYLRDAARSAAVTIRPIEGWIAQGMTALAAEATAVEIAAATAGARAARDQLADRVSQDAVAFDATDNDEWEYARSKAAAAESEVGAHDSTHDRDEAYLAAWNDTARHDTNAAGA